MHCTSSLIVYPELRSVLLALERATTWHVQEELSILQVAFSYVVVDNTNGEVNFIHADGKCHGTTRLLVIATVLA